MNISDHGTEKDRVSLSTKGESWLRREALIKYQTIENFSDEVGKRHAKQVQGITAERAIQRACRKGYLTRKSLYLEAIADALGHSAAEVETALHTGETPSSGGGRYVLPERSMQLALSLLVKLRTYRIAIGVDVKQDELPKVYESAYRMFLDIRELLEKYPAEELRTSPTSRQLFNLSLEILNEGLRPHLTEWRSRFMDWLQKQQAKGGASSIRIQQQQMRFPEIDELGNHLVETTRRLTVYRHTLEEMLLGDKRHS